MEPTYSETTERLYQRLPEVVRRADSTTGWQLKKYISGMSDQQGEVDTLVDRFDHYTRHPTSDLVDPETADAAWLRWIGQLVGINTDLYSTVDAQRQALLTAAGGFRAGSLAALVAAVQTQLTGSQYVRVYKNSDASVGGIGTKDMWHVLIVTKSGETPVSSAVVIANVIAQNAKPAGVVLSMRQFEAQWDTIESTYTTWNAIEAVNWDTLENTGI